MEIFTVGDLHTLLAPVSLVRRRAIIFALETHMQPEAVSRLTWRQALTGDLPAFARQLVVSQPRHIRLQYVFWEYLQLGIAAPLFNLEDTIIEACRRNYDDMQKVYEAMKWVDTFAEARAFKEAIGQKDPA